MRRTVAMGGGVGSFENVIPVSRASLALSSGNRF